MLHLIFPNGGLIDNGKGVNVPNKQLATPTFRKEDLEIIKFAKERNVEYFALSFVRSADDLKNLKSLLNGFEGDLIAKIENSEGVENFHEIL